MTDQNDPPNHRSWQAAACNSTLFRLIRGKLLLLLITLQKPDIKRQRNQQEKTMADVLSEIEESTKAVVLQREEARVCLRKYDDSL